MRGRQALRRGSCDLLTHRVDIHPHPLIVEPDHVEAEPFQVLAAPNIADAPLVLFSVEFDDQASVQADEIGDVAADRVLPPELQPVELAAPQPPPQRVLDIDRHAPHLPRGGAQKRRDVLVRHAGIMTRKR